MAWTASGLYAKTFADVLDATQLPLNLTLTTHKWALYNNTIVPAFGTDAAYTSTNEVTGTGYTAGGQTIASPTIAPQGGDLSLLMYDMADQTWATATITAYGAILYADALTAGDGVADALIVGVNFAGAYTSTAGNFTIAFSTNGVFTIDTY